MQKVYERIGWENDPSTNTPINEDNLNKMDYAINLLDDRIIQLARYEERAEASEENASVSENNAKVSESKAKISEVNAKTSENNALQYMNATQQMSVTIVGDLQFQVSQEGILQAVYDDGL